MTDFRYCGHVFTNLSIDLCKIDKPDLKYIEIFLRPESLDQLLIDEDSHFQAAEVVTVFATSNSILQEIILYLTGISLADQDDSKDSFGHMLQSGPSVVLGFNINETPGLACAIAYCTSSLIVYETDTPNNIQKQIIDKLIVPIQKKFNQFTCPRLYIFSQFIEEDISLELLPYFSNVIFCHENVKEKIINFFETDHNFFSIAEWPCFFEIISRWVSTLSEGQFVSVNRASQACKAICSKTPHNMLQWIEFMMAGVGEDALISFVARICRNGDLQRKLSDIIQFVRQALSTCSNRNSDGALCSQLESTHGYFHNPFGKKSTRGVFQRSGVEISVSHQSTKVINADYLRIRDLVLSKIAEFSGLTKVEVISQCVKSGELADFRQRFSTDPSTGPLCFLCGFHSEPRSQEQYMEKIILKKLRICENCEGNLGHSEVDNNIDNSDLLSAVTHRSQTAGVSVYATIQGQQEIKDRIVYGCICDNKACKVPCAIIPCNHALCMNEQSHWLTLSSGQLSSFGRKTTQSGTLIGRLDVAIEEASVINSHSRCPVCRVKFDTYMRLENLVKFMSVRDALIVSEALKLSLRNPHA